MKSVRAVLFGVITCLSAIRVANAVSGSAMKPVALPLAEGTVAGAAFSPDSSYLAVIRHAAVPGASAQRHILQIVNLKSGQETAHAEVLNGEVADPASTAHFIAYSADGHYLLLATKGSDVLSILDAAKLQTVKRFALHPEAESRTSLGERHRYFRGVVSLAVAPEAGIFAVVTHDELQDNEVFIGSFSSEQIVKSWSLGRGRTATQLGQISISLSDHGGRIAVSVLPDKNSLPKAFHNLRLYDSGSGEMVKSIRTDGLVGSISLIHDENVLASRIDTPGLFSKRACIERWSLDAGTLGGQFCDQGLDVNVALAVSLAADRVVGSASQIHKSIEGQVYAASGRVDVWDMKSGDLVASSSEMPRFISWIQVSADGEWVMADQSLFRLIPVP